MTEGALPLSSNFSNPWTWGADILMEAGASWQNFLTKTTIGYTYDLIDLTGQFLGHTELAIQTFARACSLSNDAGCAQFEYINHVGRRRYNIYVPGGYKGQPVPLIVMLHGCTQSSEDFALGTGMNAEAERHTCIVVYPEQPKSASNAKCWNWFRSYNQHRDQGEPSLIAGITRTIMNAYNIDPKQVFIGGMSAGGAMASIMGITYPDLYAAIGVHSGLPRGAAVDIANVYEAMHRGNPTTPGIDDAIPAIVFHGTHDQTVNARNSYHVVQQMIGNENLMATTVQGKQGHPFDRTLYFTKNGYTLCEHWLVRGGKHTWFGGNATASHTDQNGPNASKEMMRFFLEHPKN